MLNPAAGAVLSGLRGMGGIGKTALALVLAHEWAARFPDAQLFLDARGTQPDPPSARKLMEQVVLAFHPTAKLPDDAAAIAGIYRDVLGGKKVLILLDNALGAEQAKPLIPPAGCALIVTSRHSFMLGTVKPHDVGRLPEAEANALLREFAPDLTEAEAAALVPLCAGLPLALRLAGSHIALDAVERNGPPDIAAYILALGSGRLDWERRRPERPVSPAGSERLAMFDADAADAGEVTISETLRLSEAQLPEAEREAWRKLGVFTASFDARAAEAIAGADATMLGRFVRRSLLEREGAERFKLHDLAADHAHAQLGGDALRDLHLAHAQHYTVVADEAQALYMKGKVADGLALFDRERAQIEAAYAWLRDKVVGGFSPPPLPTSPGVANHETVRAEAPDHYAAATQQMLALVNAVVYTGDLRFHPRQRIAWLESQLRGACLVKDRQSEGWALGNLGNAHAALGDARKAIEFYEQHRTVAREIENRLGEGNAMMNLGNAHYLLGDARKAIEYHAEALSVFREIGDRRGEGNALTNLGSAHYRLGDTRKAVEYQEQALSVFREIGERRGEGNALGNLGNAHATLGDARKAIGFYEQDLAIRREIGDRRGEGIALWNFADEFWKMENRIEAIARATAALVIFEAIEDPNAAMVRAKLAEWRGEPLPPTA